MQLIDIHTHIYPPAIAEKGAASIRKFYELKTREMDGTPETLLKRGEKAGIDRFVVLPVAVRPDRTRHINQFILDQVAEESRFIGFGTIHAGMKHLTDEAQFILDSGLRGIKMHPDFQKFPIDDRRLFPVYELIGDRIPFLFHMGDTRYDYSHPARLKRVLHEFPSLRVVAAHFGGYRMYETGYEYLRNENCFFDISSSMMFMPEGVPEKLIGIYGAERMAFGTDYPLWDPVPETKRFWDLQLTAEQFELISHRTAEEILRLKEWN